MHNEEIRRGVGTAGVGPETLASALLHDVEEQIQRREQLFRAVFAGALDAMLLIEDRGHCVDANPAACALFGVPKAALLGRGESDLSISGIDMPAECRAFMTDGKRRGRFSLARGDGTQLDLEYSATADIVPDLHLFVLRDVTERKRFEEALQASEQNYRQIVDSAREGIWRIDERNKTTFANRALEEMLGYGPGEMLGKTVFEFLDEEGRELFERAIQRRREGIGEIQEGKLIKKDGSEMWGCVNASPLLDAAGNYVGALAMMTDNTARRAAEMALRRSEEQYRLLFDSSPLPKWLTDVETLRLIAVNDATSEAWGYSRQELLGMTIAEILSEPGLARVKQAVAETPKGQPVTGVWQCRRKDGSFIEMDIHAHTCMFDGRAARLVVGENVTGRKRLEAQLMQAQKMEAIGLLAGGIAHDFNNILSVISTYTSFMLDGVAPGDPLHDDLSEVAKASERAILLTRQLLAFSRQQILQPKILDLNAAVAGIENMLQRILGEGIELSFSKGKSTGLVNADPGQIEQLIMNLAVNARDAMPDGGALIFEVANVRLQEGNAVENACVVPGPYVMLAVTDTGIGMSAETRQRIFDPFFTTKPIGKGTGLGLSTVLGITQQSGGHLRVDSELGKGTTFKIYLPCAEGALVTSESIQPRAAGLRGTETILVVEDDEQVRQLARTLLLRHGYRVLDACNAGEALLICEEHSDAIDLLLTDVIMPKVDGWQLAQRLVRMCPRIKVLFMSGHINDPNVHRRLRDAEIALLQKPITADNLARKIREVLDEPALPIFSS